MNYQNSETSEKLVEIKEQTKVTRITAFHVFSVFSLKLIVSFFSKSLSFLTELTDSILDFIALFITYVGLKESRKVPDHQHMFGHYKINSVAGFIQSLLIVGLYSYILFVASQTLYLFIWQDTDYQTENTVIQIVTLIIGLVFVFLNSSAVLRIGKKQNNTLIIAQGQNFRADFYRNVSFIIGLIIITFGVAILDLVISIIFSIRSIYVGFKLLRKSFNELIDANAIQQEEIEEIETKIWLISDIKRIDSFAIRTNGNTLEARVLIQINAQKSLFGGNIIAEQIRKIIIDRFQSRYRCNIFVQFNLENNEISKEMDYIFETIRDIGLKEKKISNIHNISIDEYEDRILIQFHIDLDPNMQISQAHSIATTLENEVSMSIRETMKNRKKIEVISHIEPAFEEKKIHSHSINRPVPEETINKVKGLIEQIPYVKGIKELRMQNESEGLFITSKLLVDGSKTVEETHEITLQVESILSREIPNLKRGIIHTEPMEMK